MRRPVGFFPPGFRVPKGSGIFMETKAKKWLSLFLILTLSVTMLFGATGFAQGASYSKAKTIFENCGDYIYNTVKEPVVGTYGGEWVMYGFGHAGYDISDEYRNAYLANVEKELKETEGILHKKNFTEYSRVIIGLTAIGADASDFAGYDLTEALADFVNVKWLGQNSVMWALIALDSGDYKMPELTESYRYGTLTPKETNRTNSRQRMVNYLLANQYADGGWNILTKNEKKTGYNAVSSVDMTAMGMVALAPYRNQPKVKKALDRAIAYLSKKQNKNGGYKFYGTENSESCAQAICGLIACGVNPNTDSRFVKNGKSIVDALLTFYDEKTGGFRHVNKASGGFKPVVDQMATEQAYYALAFFYQYVPGKTTLEAVTKPAGGKLEVTWKKAAIGTDYVTKQRGETAAVSGYQIVCATDKKFTKGVKKVTVSTSAVTKASNGSLIKTVTGLKKGKTYYVKVRAYKTVNGKKIYGLYSSVKSCKA